MFISEESFVLKTHYNIQKLERSAVILSGHLIHYKRIQTLQVFQDFSKLVLTSENVHTQQLIQQSVCHANNRMQRKGKLNTQTEESGSKFI